VAVVVAQRDRAVRLDRGPIPPVIVQADPRSEEHRQAVLRATKELMLELDLRAVSVDRIAQRSGLTKATVYKWWPNKSAVAIEAFLGSMMHDAPDPTPDPRRRTSA
jgi:AcrR family transcriptional regulator